jgi:hypothetical protein
MILPLAVAVACTLPALAFTLAGSRAVSRAGRAEAATAARHRFLAAFDARGAGAPADLLVQTYETLAGRLDGGVPHGELRPGARFREDLGLEPADVEDVALLVAARCEGRIPRGRDLDALTREVATVEQLVDYLTRFLVRPAARTA